MSEEYRGLNEWILDNEVIKISDRVNGHGFYHLKCLPPACIVDRLKDQNIVDTTFDGAANSFYGYFVIEGEEVEARAYDSTIEFLA